MATTSILLRLDLVKIFTFGELYGAHTGSYLSSVLMETLEEHGIEERIFGLTTHNASNNKTLAASL
jgi:hypothetical protein